MVYYTRDRRCINYSLDLSSEMKGKQGVVYRLLDDPSVCLKEYFTLDKVESIYRDSNRHFVGYMFDYFKEEFNHSNFCKLYDLLYDKEIGTVLGYTMKYYQGMLDNILDLPVSYLLDNYSMLYDAVLKLAMDFVMVMDMHGENIINTDNGMIVIDYDQFVRSKNSEMLSFVNRQALIYAFYNMLTIAFKKKGIDVRKNKMLGYQLMELFNMLSSISFDVSPINLKNKLRSYKRTIDYFKI